MKLINLQTKQFEDVPDEQAVKAVGAGTHAFESADQAVPMRGPDGSIGTVAAKDLPAAQQAGGEVVSHEEWRKADLEARHGGIGGSLAAAGEGLARGLTVGLSDPLAIGAARAFGGDKAAEATRTHLAEEKETHPWIAGGTEVLGAAAPLALSGGAAAPVEATELARAGAGAVEAGEAVAKGAGLADRMGSLLRAVGAPARGVGAAGDAGEHLAGRLLEMAMGEPGAEGAVARITRAAVKAGTRGAAEGSLFGAGQQISEDALGDHELNAEKLVAALGHGALYGAMLGGGLGAAGGAAREGFGAVINRIAPSLERQADSQMWRAVAPNIKRFAKEAEARAGGIEAVGRTLRDELPEEVQQAMLKGQVTAEDLQPEVAKLVDRKWGQMRDLMSATGGEIEGGRVMSAVDEVIAPLRKKAGFEGVVNSLEQYKTSLADKLGIDLEGPAAAGGARADFARKMGVSLEEFEQNPNLQAAREAFAKSPAGQGATQAAASAEKKLAVTDVMDQRKALDELVYKETKSLDPSQRVEALRDVRGSLAKLEIEAVDEAAKKAGREGAGAELQGLRKDYQRLRIAQDAVDEKVAGMATHRNLSLSDNMAGMAHMAGALAAGHPMLALGGIATSFAHKAIRERGNAAAAVALGKIAKLDLIARAVNKVDAEIDTAVKGFVRSEPGKATPRIRARHFGTPADQDVQDRYEKAGARMPAAAPPITPEHVEKALPGLAAQAPKHAAAVMRVVQSTADYRAANRPKPLQAPDMFGRPVRVPDEEAAKAVRTDDAARDPVGTLTRGLETGKLHQEEIDAIAKTSPKLLAQVQQQVLAEVAHHGKKMGYEKKITASRLTGVPLDPTLTGPAVKSFQRTFAPGAGLGGAVTPGGGAAHIPKRKVTGADSMGLSAGR